MVNVVCAQRSEEYAPQAQRRRVSRVSSATCLHPALVNDICPTDVCLVSACGVVTWVSSLEWELLEVRDHLIIVICPVMNAVLVSGALSKCLPSELMNE